MSVCGGYEGSAGKLPRPVKESSHGRGRARRASANIDRYVRVCARQHTLSRRAGVAVMTLLPEARAHAVTHSCALVA